MVAFQATHTLPIFVTVMIYLNLLWILRKTAASKTTSIRKKSLARMVRGVVVGLLICNLPYIAWVGYIGALAKKGRFGDAFNTPFGVTLS